MSTVKRLSMFRVAVAVVAVVGSGCATSTVAGPAGIATGSAGAPARRPPAPGVLVKPAALVFDGDGHFAFVDGKTGAAMSSDDVVARLSLHRVVVVGEQHDQVHHHEAQRRLVQMLANAGPGLVVGLEMLSWDKQSTLDRFNNGELDAKAFSTAVDWKGAWGFDFGLYAGIFETGRASGASFLALNAPRELVRTVRKQGLAGLSDGARAQVPELDLEDEAHRRWFEGVFSSAGHPLQEAEVDAFYLAQVLWDESMAARAADAVRAGARQVVVLAGAGHIAAGRGIPQRVERRLGGNVLTVQPLTVDADSVDRVIGQAIANADADILVVPRFEVEIAL